VQTFQSIADFMSDMPWLGARAWHALEQAHQDGPSVRGQCTRLNGLFGFNSAVGPEPGSYRSTVC